MIKITKTNYFQPDIEAAFLSNSQVKRFRSCEAAALAALSSPPAASKALQVGSYVDAYCDGPAAFARYCEEHKAEIYRKDGKLYADYSAALDSIRRLRDDRMGRLLTTGRHQVIVSGVIAGEAVKGKIDVLLNQKQVERLAAEFPDTRPHLMGPDGVLMPGLIVDVKTCRDYADVWSPVEGQRVPWARYWGYDVQLSIYRELYRQMTGLTLPCAIAAVTKQTPADIIALAIPDQDLTAALYAVEDDIPHIARVKRGEIKPRACGDPDCPYCRRTRRLVGFVNWQMTGMVGRVDDYAAEIGEI